MSKVLVLDVKKCSGCRTCELICSFELKGWINPYLSRIKRITIPEDLQFVPLTCMQCEEAPCYLACPSGAIYRNADGVLKIDQDMCIGCRMCIMACPIGAPIMADDEVHKCELCDGEPKCVENCTKKALTFVDKKEVGMEKLMEAAHVLKQLKDPVETGG